MDRALKERITGAVVLVAFAVLVVPIFLDGSVETKATVTQAVTLPGQNDQPRRQQTIVLARDREEPVPAANPQVTRPEPEPIDDAEETPPAVPETTAIAATEGATERNTGLSVEKKAQPETQPEPREKPAEKPAQTASATGMWAVQLGSFSNRENAERLAADLRGAGYAAFLSQHGTNTGELHRVRIGPQKNRDDAETVAAKLTDAGHKGQVVPHP